jgi:hypothetical protein
VLRAIKSTGRWIRSAQERSRRAIIASDFSATRRSFSDIAARAPLGDASKMAWMVSSFATVWGYKIEGALSLALRIRGFAPKPIYTTSDPWGPRYHGVFGLGGGHEFRVSRKAQAGHHTLASSFLDGSRDVTDLLSLRYKDIMVGRIALSNHLNRHKFSSLNLREPATADTIARDLGLVARHVDAAEQLVASQRPSVALLLEKGVTPMAELFGVCVRDGVPVVQYAGAQQTDAYALKRYSAANITAHPFSLDESTWQRVRSMPWGAEQEREILAALEDGYRSGTWFNRKFLQRGKRIKTSDDVTQQLGLDPAKKTAVIFSHVLWDATFFYGEGLFKDYETWLIETVRAAAANPRLNWVIKLHPDLLWKLKYEGHVGELRDVLSLRAGVGALPPHVKIVMPDTDISTFSFFDITDYCLTVRGTIGIEMACHGVPVVTGGTGRYSGLGFTVDSSTTAEYLERLATLERLPPMDAHARALALRYAYTVFGQRPWHLRSFETRKSSIEQVGHPLDHNLVPHVRTFDELASAPDMKEFARWVDSSDVDYLELQTTDRTCAAL